MGRSHNFVDGLQIPCHSTVLLRLLMIMTSFLRNRALNPLLQSWPMETKESLNVGTICVLVAAAGREGCLKCPSFWVVVCEPSGIRTMYCRWLLVMFASGVDGAAKLVEEPVSVMAVLIVSGGLRG